MSRRVPRTTRALLGGLVVVAIILSAAPALAQTPGQQGRDIAALARDNGLSEDEVRSILADGASRVDARNRLYFVDPVPVAPVAAPEVEAGPFPYSQTFLLHSRAGSQRKIYLDFNGHTIANTAWNGTYGAPSGSFFASAFSTDADPATFSNAEQDIIQAVWQRVAEDYAPFDVDVTTEDPGFDAINRSSAADLSYGTRALITDTSTIYNQCSCGGIAYVGTFDETASHAHYQPALVFGQAMQDNAKYIAEAVSHEVGHNLGLSHDGTSSVGYYEGHGAWAPIMGGSYGRPITQWSKGEYSGANNTQDDHAVIASNGATALPDDHLNTAGTATSLGSGPNVSASGIITTDADVDVFHFTASTAGSATINLNPASVGPNLDILLELRNSANTVLASSNPASAQVSYAVASGLNASITYNLPSAGTYYVYVYGVGAGSASTTGYSGYASVGRYTLGGTIPTGGGNPSISINDAAAVSEGGPGASTPATFSVSLSSASPSSLSVNWATAPNTADTSDYATASGTVTFPANSTAPQTVTVSVTGDSTPESNETFFVNLSNPTGGATLNDSQGVGTINNDDSSGPANNNFASATGISGATGTLNGTSAGANKESGEPHHAGNAGGASIWYSWTAPSTGSFVFDTFGSGYDTLLGIYTGSAFNNLITVASNDNGPGTNRSQAAFAATSGVVYRIAVDGLNGANGAVKLNWAAGTSNNDFANAFGISGTNGSTTGSSVGTNKEAGEPNHAGIAGGASIWYSWTAPSSVAISLDTYGSSFDTLLAVYTGGAVNSLTQVAANNNAPGTNRSLVTFNAAAGTTYRIAVDGNLGATGTVKLNWQSPPNNNFANGTTLAGSSGTINGTTVQATKETGEPNHHGNPGGKSIWYWWTAPSNGTVTIDTFGSSYDTLLAIYTGTAVNALTSLTSNDDAGGGLQSRITWNVTAGTTYRIAVDGYNGQSGAVTLNWSIGIANNNFAGAIAVTGANGTTGGSNAGANKESGEPNHAGVAGGASIWYSWTAPATAAVGFDTFGSGFDTLLGVYTGNAVNSLTQVAANNNAPGTNRSAVSFNATSGVTYYIAVDGNLASTGTVKLTWQTPPNNHFVNAQTLAGTSGSVNGTNVSATKETGEPNHHGNPGGKSIWYQWTAAASGTLTVNTFGSGFDTLLALYTGAAVNTLTGLTSNDDAGGGLQSQITWSVTAGTTYRIAVDGYNGASGASSLGWSLT